MLADLIALYELLQKNAERITTLGALFNENGQRIEGDTEVEIERLPLSGRPDVWFYKVKPVGGYVFVPIPVVPCRIEYVPAGQNLSTEAFRFTFDNLSATTRPNLLVSFSVIGYQPKQLLDRLKQR